MDNGLWLFDTAYYKLKTARQKKRLQKEDFEKQLRTLNRLEHKLYLEKRNLPLVPLEISYQKGWVRTFRLRDDIARSGKAGFYQTLLQKINTRAFSNDKLFLTKKRKKRKKIYESREQGLETFTVEKWISPELKLTEAEKQFFLPKEEYDPFTKRMVVKYTFAEPWRYVLQIKPNMITHVKTLNVVLEQQMRQLDNLIERQHLWPKISRLKRGNVYSYHEGEKHQYHNPIKNKNLPEIIWEAMNDIL